MHASQVKAQLSPPAPATAPSPSKALQIVQKAIFDHLVELVDPSSSEEEGTGNATVTKRGEGFQFKPVKGKSNVIMAVGIQVRASPTTLLFSSLDTQLMFDDDC